MIRWPGKIPAGRVSDEIVHAVDVFPTLAAIVGAAVPKDRPIDGVDQSGFFPASRQSRARRHPDLVRRPPAGGQVAQLQAALLPAGHPDGAGHQAAGALLFNLYVNPREEPDKIAHDSWVVGPVLRMVGSFERASRTTP
jgi:arylsulfatase